MLLLLVRRRGPPCHRGSPRASVVVLLHACGRVNGAGSGWSLCMHGTMHRMGGGRELDACGVGAGAPSDASSFNRPSGC
jgi:hypothetical protein